MVNISAQESSGEIVNPSMNPHARRFDHVQLFQVLHLRFHVLLHQVEDRVWAGTHLERSSEVGERLEPAMKRILWGYRWMLGSFDAMLCTTTLSVSNNDHWNKSPVGTARIGGLGVNLPCFTLTWATAYSTTDNTLSSSRYTWL